MNRNKQTLKKIALYSASCTFMVGLVTSITEIWYKGNIALAQTVLCSNHIREGVTLSWSTQQNGNSHNNGTLTITRLRPNGTWAGVQLNGSLEEDIVGEISGDTFIKQVPRWDETWRGVCGENGIAGVIQRTNDGNHFTFLIR
ncbi:MAG: hypothetical protein F6K26_55035 [Moorea sp. SIO2I5]|nr:hypothetical protein [Moorena sp. SIO2I5]